MHCFKYICLSCNKKASHILLTQTIRCSYTHTHLSVWEQGLGDMVQKYIKAMACRQIRRKEKISQGCQGNVRFCERNIKRMADLNKLEFLKVTGRKYIVVNCNSTAATRTTQTLAIKTNNSNINKGCVMYVNMCDKMFTI